MDFDESRSEIGGVLTLNLVTHFDGRRVTVLEGHGQPV